MTCETPESPDAPLEALRSVCRFGAPGGTSDAEKTALSPLSMAVVGAFMISSVSNRSLKFGTPVESTAKHRGHWQFLSEQFPTRHCFTRDKISGIQVPLRKAILRKSLTSVADVAFDV